MTNEQKIIRHKVGLLELAKQLGSVSQASVVAVTPAVAALEWPRASLSIVLDRHHWPEVALWDMIQWST